MKKYDNPIASYCLSNNSSINIYEIVYGIDDLIKWSLNNRKINTSKIRYNDGNDYFIAYGRKIPLNECMKIYER